MSEDRDGGPAFPTAAKTLTVNPVEDGRALITHYGSQSGMTLRDYFAAAALTGSLASSHTDGEPDEFARTAYILADEMLKAREAKP